MEEIERDLAAGNTIVCGNCPYEIELGDTYVMSGKYMYCDEECAEEGEAKNDEKIESGLVDIKVGRFSLFKLEWSKER